MRLARLVEVSRRVASTRSRLEKVSLLADGIRALASAPALLPIGVAYLAGDLPQGRIGVGIAALSDFRAGARASEPSLDLVDVDRAFSAIQAEAGAGSVERRNRLVAGLLGRATPDEQDFLIRLMLGELRQGVLEGTMVDAVARAFGAEPAQVRKATMLSGALPPVAAALAQAGPAGLSAFQLRLFRPVQPMLADAAEDVQDALGRVGEAAFEYKLDGARVQVHKDGERVEVFSRRQNSLTQAVPEIVEWVSAFPERRLVLDGEAIALAPDRRPLPFQETMRRFGRKRDVARLRGELPLRVYFFDALRVGEETLIDQPLSRRWQALTAAAPEGMRVPRLETDRLEEADAFADRALAEGHEGVMAKGLSSIYAAGRRGQEWLKVKPAHTLDLVVLAAEWGSGRRKGWLSNLHLGARDPERGGFVMLGKTFKGMTDEILAWQTEALLAREIARDRITVYVRPELVVEVAFNDIQASPQYPGGAALRFARLRRYRADKRSEEADTLQRVRAFLPREPGGETL